MGKFDGIRLLELGTSVGSVDIVKYAKENGAYVIVTDVDTIERSKAKQFADQIAFVDCYDIEGLVDLCKENKINAIASGVSEKILESSRQVAERLNFPIYYTGEQWEKFMTKSTFRSLCQKYGVTAPRTFFVGEINDIGNIEEYNYPVIIKPVDASSNAGISICHTPKDLSAAFDHAANHSKTNRVIIEEYIDGEEISCTYVIKDGICKMVCMGTKYPYVNESGLRALANCYIYPSPAIDDYMRDEDKNVRRMFVEEGLNDCTIFIQGIYKDGICYTFEAGLRMEGTGSYRFTSKMTDQSFLEFMVDNAIGRGSNYDLEKEDPYFNGRKCVLFSQIVKAGTIVNTIGYEEIKNDPIIISSEQRRYPGDTIEPDGTLRQIMYRYLITSDDMDAVIALIERIKNTVKALDEDGNNILVADFNPIILRG